MLGTNAPVIQYHFPEKQRPQNKIMLWQYFRVNWAKKCRLVKMLIAVSYECPWFIMQFLP